MPLLTLWQLDLVTGTTPTPPVILVQPQSVLVAVGVPATFSVVVSNATSHQWYRNGTIIPGATGLSYSLSSPGLADSGAVFSVIVTNTVGSTVSANALLTVNAAASGSLTPMSSLTYLQLVQALFTEVGAAGSPPATTVGQSGEAARLVKWIHDSELEIQNLWVDWKWLRRTITFYTVAGSATQIVTAQNGTFPLVLSDLAEWDFKTFFILPVGSTQTQQLGVEEWQHARNEVLDTTSRQQPYRVLVMPDNSLRFDLTPDQSYQITAEYRSVPYDLKLDSDISKIPPRFANRIIVEWARMKYGNFENAAEQVMSARNQIYGVVDDRGIKQTQGMLAELENDQLYNARNSRLQQGNNIVVGGIDGADGYYGNY